MREDIIRDRTEKLEKYRAVANPYPARVKREMTLAKLIAQFDTLLSTGAAITVTGRVFGWRDQGKIAFADVRDASGKLQLLFREGETEYFALLKSTLDIGDFIEARGVPVITHRGEKSLQVSRARIISKSLRPIPSEWYGLADVETKLRKRYLDLLLNREVRDFFVKKARFWDVVRNILKKEEFLEVETPVLESVPGGADAEPFQTHHRALNEDFYLRISLELPLKKLLVGGFEKVFEIGRIFRNEGIDREHLQDYTQMECYWAYADYEDMMAFTERLYRELANAVSGSTVTSFQGATIDWGKKWGKVDYFNIFKEKTGIDLSSVTEDQLRKKAHTLGVELEGKKGKGRIIDSIFKKEVRPGLIEPCFLIDPPVEIEPLAKRKEGNPAKVERFQIMAAGTELGKGFSELNDPQDQRQRFEEQMRLREEGDNEAQRLDEDFLEALEYGMPPAAGFGMSERVFAVMMDVPVREATLFPLMRKKE